MRRGEIWLYEFKRPDKRRSVLVITRPDVIHLLHTVMVAPITSAIRGLPARSSSVPTALPLQQRSCEQRLSGPAHDLDRALARKPGEVDQRYERLDPHRGGDGVHETLERVRLEAIA